MEGAMQIEENGQGTLRNNLSGKLAYYSFLPTPLQSLRQLNLTEETYRTLSTCSRKLGELEGMLYFVPNADMYLTMYVRKEALLSSQIEGTQCCWTECAERRRIQASCAPHKTGLALQAAPLQLHRSSLQTLKI